MACDFSLAQDLALFGQAGPRHGSAPDGGSTDFLPLFVGIEAAMESCTLCEHWSAHKAQRLGLLTKVVPGAQGRRALRAQPAGGHRPLARGRRDRARRVRRPGAEREAGKAAPGRAARWTSRCSTARSTRSSSSWPTPSPAASRKTLESVRKHKLEHWDRNKETNRAWLGLNMMTEARAGFRAFHEGGKACREADFLLLRRRLAEGAVWSDELVEEILARAHGRGMTTPSQPPAARRGAAHPAAAARRPGRGDRASTRTTPARASPPTGSASSREFLRSGASGACASAWPPRPEGGWSATCSARCAPSSSARSRAAGSSRSAWTRPACARGVGLAPCWRRPAAPSGRAGVATRADHGAAQRRAGAGLLPRQRLRGRLLRAARAGRERRSLSRGAEHVAATRSRSNGSRTARCGA